MSLTYVLDVNGQPLMPTQRSGKVYRLLKTGRAKVVRREPFTIKLLYEPRTHVVQDLTLGVDTGSSKVGASVTDDEENVYYVSEVTIRNDVTKNMMSRRQNRRLRRTRKLRYRPVRFSNRKKSRRKDRFNPTMVSKINSHIREIEFVKSILPIKTLVIETGTFDLHLLKHVNDNTAFNKHWGYQKGPNYGFANSREACLNRDNYKCKCCGATKTRLEAHHIIYRSQGGSDDLENLTTLCESCHEALHRGELKEFEAKLKGKCKGSLKHATQMNSIRVQLLKYYPEAIETFGFITKANREFAGLEKSHINDSTIISIGHAARPKYKIDVYYKKRHVAKGDYDLYGFVHKKFVRLARGKVQGVRKYDKVEYRGKEYFIKSIMSTGFAKLMNIDNELADFSFLPHGYKTPKINNLKRVNSRSTTLCVSQKL